MNREDIIRMAREAKQYAEYVTPQGMECFDIYNERFAILVASAAQAKEREACAYLCEGERRLGIDDERAYYGDLMAAAIRARGDKHD